MRPIHLLPIATVFICACGQADPAPENDRSTADGYAELAERVEHISGKTAPGTPTVNDPRGISAPIGNAQGGTRTHTIHSPQYNMPMAQIELPAHWEYHHDKSTGAWNVTGQGLEVKNHGYQGFMYAMGDMAYYYQQAGGKMRRPIGPEEVLRQDLQPLLGKDGIEFLGSSDAPAIARADQQGMDGLVSFGQVRKTSRALSSDWKKGDRRYNIVVHWSAMESADMVNWGYYITVLQTDASSFDREKAGLQSALASVRYNPAYFAAYNQQEHQKAQQSWSQHNTRMQQDQAAFDAQQKAYRENSNATNEAIMGTYRSQRDASDRSQDAYINTIREEQNAVDPYTGEQIKIDHGSQQYWMDQDGNYYGTDDVLHDPNVGNTTPTEWRPIEVDP